MQSPVATPKAELQPAESQALSSATAKTGVSTEAQNQTGTIKQVGADARAQDPPERTKPSQGQLAATGTNPGLVATGVISLLLVICGGLAVIRLRRSS